VSVRVERHEGAAEIHGGRRLREGEPAFAPVGVRLIDGFVIEDRKQISLPPVSAAGFGATASRAHSPSITLDCIANIAKVGEDSTGGRPSRSA
jgi:hypothetical protein